MKNSLVAIVVLVVVLLGNVTCVPSASPASTPSGQSSPPAPAPAVERAGETETKPSLSSPQQGEAPLLSVTPTSLDFGNVPIGSSSELSFTLRNIGGSTLSSGAIVVSDPAFGIVSGDSFRLAAGETTSIRIRFTPTATTPYSGQVRLTTNGGSAIVLLSGTGVTSPQPVPVPVPSPSCMRLLNPSNGATNVPVTQLQFSWTSCPGATRYEFTLARDPALSNVLIKAFVAGTSYDFGMALDYNTDYFWKIRVIEPYPGTQSVVYTFRTVAGTTAPPQTPVLRSPVNQPEVMRLYITPDDPEIKVAVDDILSGQWRWAFNDFNALREWVATHIVYKSDQDVHGVRDYWQTPTETLKLKTGDCEDFAILLCTLMRAHKVPADQVYVAVGISSDKMSMHAYLLEKWYTGIWKVVEPQAGAWAWLTLGDWLTQVTYETVWCFNDQYYVKGVPTLPPGVYEFEVDYSFWPVTRGASVTFKRYLNAGEKVTGAVEWLKTLGGESPKMVYDWTLTVYDPDGKSATSWSGTELQYRFAFNAEKTGVYKVEILKRDYLVRTARLTINPPDWEKR